MATTVQVSPLQVYFKTAGEQLKGIQAVVLHGAQTTTTPFKLTLGHMHILFNQNMNLQKRGEVPAFKTIYPQRLTSDTPLYISSSFPSLPAPPHIISITSE